MCIEVCSFYKRFWSHKDRYIVLTNISDLHLRIVIRRRRRRRYDPPSDQLLLHLLEHVRLRTRVLVEHVARALQRGELQAVRVAERAALLLHRPVVADLELLDLPVQYPDVATVPPEPGDHYLERGKYFAGGTHDDIL